MALTLLLLAAIVTVWIIDRWNSRKYLKLALTVPCSRWSTLLGFGKIIKPTAVLGHAFEYAKKYGPNSVIWLANTPCFLTSDPPILKEILTSPNCINKGAEHYAGLAYIAGDGLFTEKDPPWSHHRKLLNKAFTNKNLVSFLPDFHTDITHFIGELEKSVDQGEDLDVLINLRTLALKSSSKTMLKRDMELTKYNSSVMVEHFEPLLSYIVDLAFVRILSYKWVRKLAEISIYKRAMESLAMFQEFANHSISLGQQKPANDPSFLANKNSILDYILDDSQKIALNTDEKYGNVANIFVAALETTSTSLYSAMLMMAMYPEYQERAYEEVSKVLEDHNSELTINQLEELVYLEMVFNETLRLLPSIPMVIRQVSNEDLTLSNGWTLRVGLPICIDIFRVHRRKDLWGPEANKFNPDNFLPSNVAERHPYAFIPFTKGQRFCIGYRYSTLFFKMAFAKIIAKFKLSTDFKYENLRFENHISLKFIEAPRIRFERRKA